MPAVAALEMGHRLQQPIDLEVIVERVVQRAHLVAVPVGDVGDVENVQQREQIQQAEHLGGQLQRRPARDELGRLVGERGHMMGTFGASSRTPSA
ncbi:Uncharacterised protein [Mycobacteroides abscessus subsp. abscessus]|nr:Uncharacterised protein [Mycobacteroides abscessus subsp. abscessus]